MLREARIVAGKDLKIERRSKVGLGQVAPFAFTVLLIFGFALEPDSGALVRAAAGLFWTTVLLSSILMVQRSFSFETEDGGRDGMRLSGLDPAAIFTGKAVAVAVQLAVLEVLLIAGVIVLYGVSLHGIGMLLMTSLLATVGLASAGTIYGVMSAGIRVRETLLPLLYLPVVAPVLLAAARASEAAINGTMADGWPWVRLLAVFAVIYSALGTVVFGPLLEDS